MNRLCRPALFACVLAGSVACRAQVDPWEFEVYPYATAPRGMMEIETSNAVVSSGHKNPAEGTSAGTFASDKLWYNAYELSYGLTDRLEAAAYATLAQPNGNSLQWAGSKFRLRGRFFDAGTLPVDLGWYAEFESHRTPRFDDAGRELELRLVLEKDCGAVGLMLNPKFEKVLSGTGRHQGFEFGYAAGIQCRWRRRFSPALEFYGGTGLIDQPAPGREQQHYVFPCVWGELPAGLEYNAGVGYGLTRGSDRVIFKVNVELERFVGGFLGR